MDPQDRYTDEIDNKARVVINTWARDRSSFTREDVEDCLQEARLACWQWLVRNPEGELGGGLVRLLATQAAQDYERATRREREAEEAPPWTDPGAESEAEFNVMLGDILGKIVNDDFEASVALLTMYEELTIREAADYLEVPFSKVQRAMLTLRSRAIELGIVPATKETT